jgi:hypothetical protein
LIDHLAPRGQSIHDFLLAHTGLTPLIMVNFCRRCHARALFFLTR